jgi:hypothetical protein
VSQRKKKVSSLHRTTAKAIALRDLRLRKQKILKEIDEEIILLRFKRSILEKLGKSTFGACCD